MSCSTKEPAPPKTTLRAAEKHPRRARPLRSDNSSESAQQFVSVRASVERRKLNHPRLRRKHPGLPRRLAEIEDRLAALDRLKRKYGQVTRRGHRLRRRSIREN